RDLILQLSKSSIYSTKPIILSGAGGCNSCGETFKTFNLSGEEINEKSTTLDLEPMQDIIPELY
ncbi:hypothetical protein ACR92V_27085, partial [Klebsiella pneumoniae]